MLWMPHRVQPRLLWTAVLGGLLVVCGQLQAGGLGEPAGTGGGIVAAGGARASGGERSSGAVEGGRAFQSAPAPRAAMVQNGANERVAVASQAMVRGPVANSSGGAGTVAGAATSHYVLHYGNAWTDPAGTGQRQRSYSTPQTTYKRGGPRRGSQSRPFLYQYYGGYYPVYVDAPYGGDYYDGDATVNSGYDGGPAVVPDPGAPVGPVIAPSSITVSPETDGTQPSADANTNANTNANGNANATGSQDTAQGADHTPNPAIGPDSLVEAVQAELTRRGYYQGKVDAMFRPDTEAALRRFQQDNYLAPTGHLNEPTLHALNLD